MFATILKLVSKFNMNSNCGTSFFSSVCLGWCCPCILSWKIAKSLGESPLLYCLGSFILPITPLMRQRTREKFGMTVRNSFRHFPKYRKDLIILNFTAKLTRRCMHARSDLQLPVFMPSPKRNQRSKQCLDNSIAQMKS